MVNKQHCSVSLLQPPVLIRPGAFCFLLMKQVLLSRVTYSPVNKCISSFTALPGMCSSDFGKTVVPSWQMLHWHRVFLLLPFFPWGKNSTNFTSLLYLSALIAFLERMIWRCEFSFRCTHRHCHCHCHVPVFRLHSGSLQGVSQHCHTAACKATSHCCQHFLVILLFLQALDSWMVSPFLSVVLSSCLVFLLLSTRGPLHTPLSRHLPSFICPPLLSPSHSLLSIFHSPPLILFYLSFTLPLSLFYLSFTLSPSSIYLSLSPSHFASSAHTPCLVSKEPKVKGFKAQVKTEIQKAERAIHCM